MSTYMEATSPSASRPSGLYDRARSYLERPSNIRHITALDGRLLNVNQALTAMLGFTADELQGKHFNPLTHPEDLEIGGSVVRAMLLGEMPNTSFEKPYLTKSGEPVWAQVNSTLLRDSLGQPMHLITHILNVSARKQMEAAVHESAPRLDSYHTSALSPDAEWLDFLETLAGQAVISIDNAQLFENLRGANVELEERGAQRTEELNKTKLELEQANSAKDEFLANMSYELRTPLNSILGLSEILLEQKRDPLSEVQQRYLRTIEASGTHLLELINDILDLAKIEAGKVNYYPELLGIAELCRSSLAFVKERAPQKSITLKYQPDATADRISADPRRLKQMLVNPFTNAVKFTPHNGQVTLQVSADPELGCMGISSCLQAMGSKRLPKQKNFSPASF
jgi:PAS domain S-box-containing protein